MTIPRSVRRLSTPRTAAIAGILFSVLFAASIFFIRTSLPADNITDLSWIGSSTNRLTWALSLMPLAGIAFLWFVGVVRDKLGEFEDQFFSTVFFGSSLLFLAMVFVSMAIAGGILLTAQMNEGEYLQPEIVVFGRSMMLQITNVYAIRMAGVFMISLATIWLRTGIMHKTLVVTTYILALVLLFVFNLHIWITMIFPAWVLLVSIFILVIRLRNKS